MNVQLLSSRFLAVSQRFSGLLLSRSYAKPGITIKYYHLTIEHRNSWTKMLMIRFDYSEKGCRCCESGQNWAGCGKSQIYSGKRPKKIGELCMRE